MVTLQLQRDPGAQWIKNLFHIKMENRLKTASKSRILNMTSATLEQADRVNYSRFVYVRGLAKTKSTQNFQVVVDLPAICFAYCIVLVSLIALPGQEIDRRHR